MSKYQSFILLTALAALTISCGKETIPEPIEELSEEEILAQVRTDVQNTAFYKDIFLDGGCELNPGIKESGVVINGRLPYALQKAGLTDAEYFLSTVDDVGEGFTTSDLKLQTEIISGTADDPNGVLLCSRRIRE